MHDGVGSVFFLSPFPFLEREKGLLSIYSRSDLRPLVELFVYFLHAIRIRFHSLNIQGPTVTTRIP